MIIQSISVKQPWAGLISAGIMPLANVGWFTKLRGPIAILASREKEIELDFLRAHIFRKHKVTVPEHLVTGGLLAIASIESVVNHSGSEWFRGPYAIMFTHIEPVTFLPIIGRSKLYPIELPDEYERHISC